MSSLRDYLQKVVAGELIEQGGRNTAPTFDQEDMDKCVTSLNALLRLSNRGPQEDRLQPPSAAIPLIL